MPKNDFQHYARLLDRAREGDDEAFRKIYQITCSGQKYHLRSILDRPEDIKDALQEVYLLLYQNMDKVYPSTVLIAYLNRLSYHVGRNIARREYVRSAASIDMDWLDKIEEPKAQEELGNAEKQEQIEIVRDAMKHLPEQEQSVLFMRYYQKLKHHEVALSLGLSVPQAKRIQHSAQKHMRELLKQKGILSFGALIAESYGLSKPTPPASGLAAVSGGNLLAGAAAVGLSLAVAGNIGFSGGPQINSIEIPSEPTREAVTVTADISSDFPIRSVSVTDAKGKAVDAAHERGRLYKAVLDENGKYTLTVHSGNGKTDEKELRVSSIDQKAPEVTDLSEENDLLAIVIKESGSGINYDKVYCTDKRGNKIMPVRVDKSGQTVWFTKSDKNMNFYVADMAGNTGSMPLYYKDDK